MSSFLSHRRKAFRGGATDPVADPLHYWDLNSLSTSGGLEDKGSGSNDMTLQQTGVAVTTSGAPDGTNCLNLTSGDVMDTSSNFAWDGSSLTTFSISYWVRVASFASSSSTFLSWRGGAGQNRLFTCFARNSDKANAVQIWDDTQTGGSTTESSNDPNTDLTVATWHHILATGNLDGDLKTYLDGSLVTSATVDASSLGDLEDTATLPFAIGSASQNKTSTVTQHQGRVWAFGIWDVELDADDATHLYNSGNGRLYADL
jgi:hypothetical protein